jgi:hypothetical protein
LSSTHWTFAIPLESIDSTTPKHRSGCFIENVPCSPSKIVGEAETRSPTLATFLPFPFRFLGLLVARIVASARSLESSGSLEIDVSDCEISRRFFPVRLSLTILDVLTLPWFASYFP